MSFIVNNSANNFTLYYNVLDYFRTIMENHPSIEVVAQGDIFSVDQQEYPQYVCYPGGKLPIPVEVPYPTKKGQQRFFQGH